MHAERDIVLTILSVCPSSTGTVSKWMYTIWRSGGASFWFFSSPAVVTKFQGKPLSAGVKYKNDEKI